MGLHKHPRLRVYLTEEQVERFDELAELEEGDALDEAGQAELNAMQKILDGEYQPDQKAIGRDHGLCPSQWRNLCFAWPH